MHHEQARTLWCLFDWRDRARLPRFVTPTARTTFAEITHASIDELSLTSDPANPHALISRRHPQSALVARYDHAINLAKTVSRYATLMQEPALIWALLNDVRRKRDRVESSFADEVRERLFFHLDAQFRQHRRHSLHHASQPSSKEKRSLPHETLRKLALKDANAVQLVIRTQVMNETETESASAPHSPRVCGTSTSTSQMVGADIGITTLALETFVSSDARLSS